MFNRKFIYIFDLIKYKIMVQVVENVLSILDDEVTHVEIIMDQGCMRCIIELRDIVDIFKFKIKDEVLYRCRIWMVVSIDPDERRLGLETFFNEEFKAILS